MAQQIKQHFGVGMSECMADEVKWFGLTEEDIEGCLHHVDDEAVIGLSDFARAVEQLLRSKNS
jgi:hypothetical protein